MNKDNVFTRILHR